MKRMFLSGLILVAILSGCAHSIEESSPRQIINANVANERRIVFEQHVKIELPTYYTRGIRSGSSWRLIGSIHEGDVYRPIDSVFTIEGKHDHEAYLVISNNTLQGFYLPVQQTFSPMEKKLILNFR